MLSPASLSAAMSKFNRVVLAKIGNQRSHILTVSKGCFIIAHKIDKGYQPFKHYNKFGLTFDLNNNLAFSNSHEKALPKRIVRDSLLET